ncbi:hypothetical protein OQA88_2869 [Cercophora sp. LCS_1]
MANLSDEEFLALDTFSVREKFAAKTLTVRALLERTLEQIRRYNPTFKALISEAPHYQLRERADELDAEWQRGRRRSPLHGIPVILEDSIAIGHLFGMKTSVGSFALLGNTIIKNAPIVDRLLNSGAIIVGKANLSELCAFKGNMDQNKYGFSPVGGRTISPFIADPPDPENGPSSYSTGCTAGVAAGFAIIAIGTDIEGDVVRPSSRHALCSLKPTKTLADQEGYWRVSQSLDSPGVIARSARDIAAVTKLILGDGARDAVDRHTLWSGLRLNRRFDAFLFLNPTFNGMRIGFVDPEYWRPSPRSWRNGEARMQHHDAYHSLRLCIERTRAHVIGPVQLPRVEQLEVEGRTYGPWIVRAFELKQAAQKFFDEYTSWDSPIRNLEALVDFNSRNVEKCLPRNAPDQEWLRCALRAGNELSEGYSEAISRIVELRQEIDKIFDDLRLDVVVAPMESGFFSLSTASGYPIASVPLDFYTFGGVNSRPFGLAVLGRPEGEEAMIRFMSACESMLRDMNVPRPTPWLLKQQD